MPIDEFKTQVLLLHSEQSTLDTLSSGFTDQYTVHCATSGSEALNTLVDTPINVIVTAQELPGMSGLEALREARKRSPDTVGILLAGGADSGLEALVGDKEVFKIVRGNVSNDEVLKLVENATQQLRLSALAESANDTAANPDEPQAEHIVMETSENGAPIISDGTGRMPALDPTKVSGTSSYGSKAVGVLVLTKDQDFLDTIRDSSRGMHEVVCTNTLAEADEALRKNKIGVAVVDSAMVGDKVEQLTQHLRKKSPRLVAIVAGRRDDGEMLMDLINRGKVYRFLMKPVSPGRARLAVEASVKHHLEAPVSAFLPNSKAGTAALATKATQKPTAAPTEQPAPAPKRRHSAPQAAPAVNVPIDPPIGTVTIAVEKPNAADATLENRLSDAFGDDDNRFVETVTGLLSSAGKSFSANTDATSHGDLDLAAFSDSGTTSRSPRTLGIGAVAVLVVAVGVFWFASGSDDSTTNTSTTATSKQDSGLSGGEAAIADDNIDIDVVLEKARLARDSGRIFSPDSNNAIEFYTRALRVIPGDPEITDELAPVLESALGIAEDAMLQNRLDVASAALQRVRAADANHARLPFLMAQLAQMELRDHLLLARTAIRESRFEDAAAAIVVARNLGVSDASEIDTVDDELEAAISSQRVDDVLVKANERLESGDLLFPANDNARYFYELALLNDAGNTVAQQGLAIVASRLIARARTEIDNGNYDTAERLLSDAQSTDSANADIALTARYLTKSRDAIAERQRAAAVATAAEEERQAAAVRQAELERQAELARQAELENQAALEAQAGTETQPGADSPAAPVPQTSPQQVPPDAGSVIAESVNVETADAAPQKLAVTTPPTTTQRLVPISSLQRTRYVAPKYPRNAQRRNLSGWVDVVFTVSVDGTTKDVIVKDSEPREVFVASAVRAVEKWEFEPIIENATIVEKQAGVRMMFALE